MNQFLDYAVPPKPPAPWLPPLALVALVGCPIVSVIAALSATELAFGPSPLPSNVLLWGTVAGAMFGAVGGLLVLGLVSLVRPHAVRTSVAGSVSVAVITGVAVYVLMARMAET